MFRKEAALCQLWVGRIRSPTALENHTSDLQNPKMRIAGVGVRFFAARGPVGKGRDSCFVTRGPKQVARNAG